MPAKAHVKRRVTTVFNPLTTDPNIENKNRTFEVTYMFSMVEEVVTRQFRIRFAAGDPTVNTFDIGNSTVYVGMISARQSNGHWTPYGWGHLPVDMAPVVREVFPSMEKKPEEKDDAKTES